LLSEAPFHRGAGFSFIGLSVRRSDDDAALALGNGGANAAIADLAEFNITGNGNTDIGFHEAGVAGENNTTRIGNISATAQDTGIYVTLDAVGGTKLGYVNLTSSRIKQDIR
jgi:hypothetical protein